MTGCRSLSSRGNATHNRVVFPRVCRWIAAAVFCLGVVTPALAQHLPSQHLPGSVITNTARATHEAVNRPDIMWILFALLAATTAISLVFYNKWAGPSSAEA